MAFGVQIVEHTRTPRGHECLTFALEFPRIILAETNTHSLNSRNAASSRAMPTKRLLDQIYTDPFIPLDLGKNKAGMQAGDALTPGQQDEFRKRWVALAKHTAAEVARWQTDFAGHKQHLNRPLEPFLWTKQVMTATRRELSNFFHQRCHWKAQPEFRRLARAMYVAVTRSTPRAIDYGEWHLPYITPADHQETPFWLGLRHDDAKVLAMMKSPAGQLMCQVSGSNFVEAYTAFALALFSAARCARVSYFNHDGSKPNLDKDWATALELLDRPPASDDPIHWSPTQHQGTPLHKTWEAAWPHFQSNLKGYMQLRKFFPGECRTEYAPSDEEVKSWGVDEADFRVV